MARTSLKNKVNNKVSLQSTSSYWQNLESEVSNNQSKISMVLGGLIIFVVILLVFNFFNKNKSSLGPAQTTENNNEQQQDVNPERLPGKYTVKEGDTLFTIAQTYYKDGFKFSEIAKANNLTNADAIEQGQVLEIPKLETAEAVTTPSPSASVEPSITPQAIQADPTVSDFGPKITSNSYTVTEGDWLSTIAARAYGDVMQYTKIAQANNISNPDYITPGQVLTIPR